jgi:hypothetical protein
MEFTQEQKLFAEIVQKAWEDADFKKELISNPVAAIEKLTGKKLNLPEGKTLVVRDQTDESTVYINIPSTPEVDLELNEEQLEAVSGGCQFGDSGTGGNIGWPQKDYPNPIKDIILF